MQIETFVKLLKSLRYQRTPKLDLFQLANLYCNIHTVNRYFKEPLNESILSQASQMSNDQENNNNPYDYSFKGFNKNNNKKNQNKNTGVLSALAQYTPSFSTYGSGRSSNLRSSRNRKE